MTDRGGGESGDIGRLIEARLAAQGVLNRAVFDSSVLRGLFMAAQEWRSVLRTDAPSPDTAARDRAP
jgi:hypothetical protein